MLSYCGIELLLLASAIDRRCRPHRCERCSRRGWSAIFAAAMTVASAIIVVAIDKDSTDGIFINNENDVARGNRSGEMNWVDCMVSVRECWRLHAGCGACSSFGVCFQSLRRTGRSVVEGECGAFSRLSKTKSRE